MAEQNYVSQKILQEMFKEYLLVPYQHTTIRGTEPYCNAKFNEKVERENKPDYMHYSTNLGTFQRKVFYFVSQWPIFCCITLLLGEGTWAKLC